LSDIAPLSLSIFDNARLSRNVANNASKSFLCVPGINQGVLAVPTASDRASPVSISSICLIISFDCIF
jgi:hypothetical protein